MIVSAALALALALCGVLVALDMLFQPPPAPERGPVDEAAHRAACEHWDRVNAIRNVARESYFMDAGPRLTEEEVEAALDEMFPL